MATTRIWPATDGSAFASEDDPVNLGTEFYVTQQAWAVSLHIWRFNTTMSGTVLGRIWIASGASAGTALAGTDVTFNLSGTGWLTADLDAPVELTPLVRYRVSMLAPSGYTGTGSYWTSGAGSSGITSGIIIAPSSGPGGDQSGKQGSFEYDSVRAYPDSTFQGGNYWVDVTVSDVFPTPVGENMSIADTARANLLTELGLTVSQGAVYSNVDLMRLLLEDPDQELVTETGASAAVQLVRYMMSLR